MKVIENKMIDLAKEIDDFIRKNEANRKPANKFPFEKYKDLNRRVFNLHIEMAKDNSAIFLSEGIEWFRKYAEKLTNFLPDDEN